jgi:hypothetical protein
VREEAAARLEADYRGERARLLEAAQAGESFGDLDTAMAKKIVAREALTAVKANNHDRIYEAAQFIRAYRMSGTEQARGMGMRHDETLSPAERMSEYVAQAILTPPQKLRDRIDKAKSHRGEEQRPQGLGRQMKRLKQRLKDIGLDMDAMTDEQIVKFLESRTNAAQAVHAIASAKSDVWDALYEYWVASILSGPATNVANMVGNIGNAAWEFTAQHMMESVVNVVAQDPHSATFGEMPHVWAGFLPGMADGWRRALQSWKTEVAVFDAEVMGHDTVSEKHKGRALG